MRRLALVAALALAPAPVAAQVLEAHVEGRLQNLDLTAEPAAFAATGPVWWRGVVTRFGQGFLRLHLVAEAEGQVPPVIVSIEGDRGGLFSYSLDDLGSDGLWTAALPSGRIVVSLIAAERPEGLTLRADQVMVEGDTGALFSVWGGVDETLAINDPDVPAEVRALAAPVARLSFFRGGRPRACTGFLVGPDLLLTNEHCVSDHESCRSMTAIFGYEHDATGRLGFGTQARCAETLGSDFDLDAALVRLDRAMGAAFGVARLADGDAPPRAPLAVIQHPGGAPKQVSFINCAVLAAPVDGRAPASDLAHSCDTASGSSGAPVFDLQGRVVALHHYGFAEGQVDDWTDNRAVLNSHVAEWLATAAPGSP